MKKKKPSKTRKSHHLFFLSKTYNNNRVKLRNNLTSSLTSFQLFSCGFISRDLFRHDLIHIEIRLPPFHFKNLHPALPLARSLVCLVHPYPYTSLTQPSMVSIFSKYWAMALTCFFQALATHHSTSLDALTQDPRLLIYINYRTITSRHSPWTSEL